jgi:hypothetical protein
MRRAKSDTISRRAFEETAAIWRAKESRLEAEITELKAQLRSRLDDARRQRFAREKDLREAVDAFLGEPTIASQHDIAAAATDYTAAWADLQAEEERRKGEP